MYACLLNDNRHRLEKKWQTSLIILKSNDLEIVLRIEKERDGE